MRPHHWLVLILLLAAVVAVAVVLRPLAEAAGARMAPPPSAADLLLQRQETSPPTGGFPSLLIPPLVLLGAFLLAFSRSGAEFLRQWRLTRRRSPRQGRRQSLPTLHELPPVPSAGRRRAGQAEELPTWRDS